MLSLPALNKRMTGKSKCTPYEIGLKVKALLDEKVGTKDILLKVGIKQAQLTTYKKIIKNGRLEDIQTKSVCNILFEEKRAEQARKVAQSHPDVPKSPDKPK